MVWSWKNKMDEKNQKIKEDNLKKYIEGVDESVLQYLMMMTDSAMYLTLAEKLNVNIKPLEQDIKDEIPRCRSGCEDEICSHEFTHWCYQCLNKLDWGYVAPQDTISRLYLIDDDLSARLLKSDDYGDGEK